MARKTEERRAKLRQTLVDVAEATIAREGIHALKAREVAKEAGCALGAIYTHFPDMRALAMEVNGRTFRKLGMAVRNAVDAEASDNPHDALIIMSHAYLGFAAEHTNLWRALFDLEMSTDAAVPNWYLEELNAVFALIGAPLAQIHTEKSPEELGLSVRTLFSAVHGIVLLGLEKRISAVPREKIKSMISELLGSIGR